MGRILKNPIQWEFETRQVLSMKLHVVGGVCGFYYVLEPGPSVLKHLAHNVVVADETEPHNQVCHYSRSLVGNNLRVVASCAPPLTSGVLHDLLLPSSAKIS